MGKGSSNSRSGSGGGGNADACASTSLVDHNFSTPAKRQVAEQTGPEDPHLPTMIVFDLDYCLWDPEMHELSGMPSVEVEGPLDPDGDFASTPLGCVGLSVPKRRRNGRGRTTPSWELDDGYGDHVGDLKEALGVVGQRTPNGLTFDEFTRGLEEYRRESEQREGQE